MSSFRNKLVQLDGKGIASNLCAGSEPTSVGASCRTKLIEHLRQQVDKIASRASIARSPDAPSSFRLPFQAVETAAGELHARIVSLERNHRVGRIPLHHARLADPAMLSLLALDPALAGLDVRRALYFDTETTGLAGGTGTIPFLIGLGWFDESGEQFNVEQLLLRQPGQEKPLLERVLDLANSATFFVTFNGKAFDLPLIRTRLVMNKMSALRELPHLDLLHVARRLHGKRLGSCSLGAVEDRVLGFERCDDVPSCEVSSRYFHFLRTGDEQELQGVVQHNEWDVISMAALVGLYGAPEDGLHPLDMVGAASTFRRARRLDVAAHFANEAVVRGGGEAALRVRAAISKARGERDSALADFESVLAHVDDPGVRLELAKLYEHHRKRPDKALAVIEQGTSEPQPLAHRRQKRLQRKLNGETPSQHLLPGIDARVR